MNAKKVKLLRRVARGLTVGKPNVSYVTKNQTTNSGGVLMGSQIVLGDCTRLRYKQLKRAVKTARAA